MTSQIHARRPALDLLRLLSALTVLCFHYGFRMGVTGDGGGAAFPELAPFAMWCDTGLLVFFTISGYVIALSAEGRTPLDFALGRFARLWPAFVVCATITALVLLAWPVPSEPRPTLVQWAAHALILSRIVGQPFLDGAYWTIAYEILFYGWVLLLLWTGLFRRGWRLFVLAWLAVSVANQFGIDSKALRTVAITEYSGYFGFGLVFFKAQRSRAWIDYALLALTFLWATATPFLIEHRFVEDYGMHRNDFGLLLVGPAAVLSVAALASIRSLPLPKSLVVGLGALTYPLYLLHQNIGYATFTHFGPTANRWLVLIALVATLLIVAWLIASFVEKPARKSILHLASHWLRPEPADIARESNV